uniref:Putative glycoprotein n=1 Tax=Blechmonas ayalai leishbunyavirus 1 TaxID=2364197 RepID=A0A386ISA5_9VIRU|nr:putative glycoprotein [Blechmonas ayalai leishbunyavirus 1]
MYLLLTRFVLLLAVLDFLGLFATVSTHCVPELTVDVEVPCFCEERCDSVRLEKPKIAPIVPTILIEVVSAIAAQLLSWNMDLSQQKAAVKSWKESNLLPCKILHQNTEQDYAIIGEEGLSRGFRHRIENDMFQINYEDYTDKHSKTWGRTGMTIVNNSGVIVKFDNLEPWITLNVSLPKHHHAKITTISRLDLDGILDQCAGCIGKSRYSQWHKLSRPAYFYMVSASEALAALSTCNFDVILTNQLNFVDLIQTYL